jgi:hypothetical protein
MDIFQTMRLFIAVAQSGSFTAAAKLLDTNTGNAPKAVSSLEARLQTRLINRTTQRLALTEAGVCSGLISVSIEPLPSHAYCLRQVPGDVPNWRLNARRCNNVQKTIA